MTESEKLAKSNFIIGLRNVVEKELSKMFFEWEKIGRIDLAEKCSAISATVSELVEQVHEIHTGTLTLKKMEELYDEANQSEEQ